MEIVRATGTELGSLQKVWIDREDRSLTYVLNWRIKKEDGSLVTGNIDRREGGTSLVEWILPLELGLHRPADREFDLQLQLVAMDEDGMVDNDTLTVTVTVPDNTDTRPQLEELELVPEALGDIPGLFVQQISQVKAAVTAYSTCSEIVSYSLRLGGKTITSRTPELLSGPLTISGAVTVTVLVTDSRGYTTQEERQLEVLPYALPRVTPAPGQSKVMVDRWDKTAGAVSDNGTGLVFRCGRSYSQVVAEGVQKNFCRLQARWRWAEAAEYGPWTLLLSEDSPQDDCYIAVVHEEFQPTREYLVQLQALDTAGNATTMTLRLGAMGCALHLPPGGKALAVGQFAPGQAERIDFGWPVHFHKGAAPQLIWRGTAEEGETLNGADPALAMEFTLFLVTAGKVPLVGVRYGNTLMASYGRYTIQFFCTPEAMELVDNGFGVSPDEVWGIL